MTEKIRMAETLLEQMEKVILKLRQNEDRVVTGVGDMLPNIVEIFRGLFHMADQKDIDIEIPVDILIQQLENFEQFYQQQDIVQLADTLEYEVQESVRFYIEILKIWSENICGVR